MIKVLVLSSVTACLAFLVSSSELLYGVRAAASRAIPWAGKLLMCGYCSGHWIGAALVILCRPQLFPEHGLLGYVLSWLALSWFAGLQWAGLVLILRLNDAIE